MSLGIGTPGSAREQSSGATTGLFDAEKALREAATALQMGAPRSFISARLNQALEILSKVAGRLHGPAAGLADYAARAVECVIASLRAPAVDLQELRELRDKVEEQYERLTGRRCAFRVGESLPSLLNDIAACVHRLAELLARGRTIGRCTVVAGASGEATRLCIEWSRYEQLLHRLGLVYDSDYENTWAYAVDGRVYIRAGGAPEHATEVDLEKGVIRYYDRDMDVASVLATLLKKLTGLRCEYNSDAEVMECHGTLSRDKLPVLAAVLAAATSMDIRMDDPLASLAGLATRDKRLVACILERLAEARE